MCKKCMMMYGTYRLQYLHNTKHHPPSPPQTEEKGYFDVHLLKRAFPFYTYIPEVRIRVKSLAFRNNIKDFLSGVSIIRFFAWQEEEGELQKKRERIQAGKFYNIIQYRYRYIVRMFKFSYLVVHGAT